MVDDVLHQRQHRVDALLGVVVGVGPVAQERANMFLQALADNVQMLIRRHHQRIHDRTRRHAKQLRQDQMTPRRFLGHGGGGARIAWRREGAARDQVTCTRASSATLLHTAMEALLGITGRGFTIIASDNNAARSIIKMKSNENKQKELSKSLVLTYMGESGTST